MPKWRTRGYNIPRSVLAAPSCRDSVANTPINPLARSPLAPSRPLLHAVFIIVAVFQRIRAIAKFRSIQPSPHIYFSFYIFPRRCVSSFALRFTSPPIRPAVFRPATRAPERLDTAAPEWRHHQRDASRPVFRYTVCELVCVCTQVLYIFINVRKENFTIRHPPPPERCDDAVSSGDIRIRSRPNRCENRHFVPNT